MTTFTQHPDCSLMLPYVEQVRDCIEGEPKIKSERMKYLKHPNMIDQTSPQQLARYEAYIDGAEFDEFPAATESQMLGDMTRGEFVFELPGKLAELEQDSDGDGMPLDGAVEFVYRNLLEVKWHVLVAEYQGLGNLDTKDVSLQDLKELNPRATIKHYRRESVIDWDFKKIGGAMQLSMLVLKEVAEERDTEAFTRKEITSHLVLGLDAEGNYYQQKYVTGVDGSSQADGERNYPMIGGQMIKFIPAEVVVDQEWPAGTIPRAVGYLGPVCSTALYRYRESADYKEALRYMQPTTFSQGWKASDKELFSELNGRDYIAFGAGVSNQLPEGVTVDVVGLGIQTQPFTEYFDQNARKARALGASFDNQDMGAQSSQTAREAGINSAKKTAVMAMIANNVEAAFKRVIAYCGMFEGLFSVDKLAAAVEQIEFNVPRGFGETKLTTQEVAEIRNNVQAGLISKDEGLRQLEAGGWTVEDAETIIGEIEEQGPEIGGDNPLNRQVGTPVADNIEQ